jgi:hypothetical protein
MSVEVATVTGCEPVAYARGYVEALEGYAPELEQLRAEVTRVAEEVAEARAAAGRIYYQAYCSCNKTIAARTIRGIEIMQA